MIPIYVDSEFKCHTVNDGTMTEVHDDFFKNKCVAFVEGYCYEPSNKKNYPWKPYDQLAAAQAQYEAMLTEMDAAYQEGVAEA